MAGRLKLAWSLVRTRRVTEEGLGGTRPHRSGPCARACGARVGAGGRGRGEERKPTRCPRCPGLSLAPSGLGRGGQGAAGSGRPPRAPGELPQVGEGGRAPPLRASAAPPASPRLWDPGETPSPGLSAQPSWRVTVLSPHSGPTTLSSCQAQRQGCGCLDGARSPTGLGPGRSRTCLQEPPHPVGELAVTSAGGPGPARTEPAL